MKICPKCNKEYDDEFMFCHTCGGKLEEKITPYFCQYCGNKIEKDVDYCPYCGKPLKQEKKMKDSLKNGANVSKKRVNHDSKNTLSDSEEPFFSVIHLFSYEGRRGRMSFFQVGIFWYVISNLLMMLTVFVPPLMIITILLLLYPTFCNIAKRFHDLDLSTSCAIIYFALMQILSIALEFTKQMALNNNYILYGRIVVDGI